jgi:hypothetical protein
MAQRALIAGTERILGCLPRTIPPGTVYPVFGERPTARLIPRAEWIPCDWSHFITRVLDQDGTGACNAFASVQAIHMLRAAAGLPYVELSAGNLYGRINGGRDAGSTLVDAIRELERRGVCRAALVGQLEWQPWRWPKNWQEDAIRFRVLEAWDCPTFDHIASAVQLGFGVNIGILIGTNFEPGTDGWVPDRKGRAGGHAMCAVGLERKGDVWGIKVVNSWGEKWGRKGYAIIPESYFRDVVWTDGWAVRVVVDPEGPE